ncbi:MAG: hypothetical protein CL908_17510 [Deltaproteobacteria bacterium]|jgi:hypothetical protein|nr:hypothetical protein [Deltaproteobacteria bacterium]
MKRRFRGLLAGLLLLPGLLSLPGCLVLAAGAGAGAGATWHLSAAREEVDADPRQVIAAAALVFDDMDFAIETRRASALDGKILGRTARGERVEVVVDSRVEGRSGIRVRVGLIDDDAARLILGRIVARL